MSYLGTELGLELEASAPQKGSSDDGSLRYVSGSLWEMLERA